MAYGRIGGSGRKRVDVCADWAGVFGVPFSVSCQGRCTCLSRNDDPDHLCREINWLARYPHGRVGVLVLNLSGKANGAQTPREKFALDRAFALIDGHPEESK